MSNHGIGPGALDTGDSPFLLSKPEWIAVQQYVISALHLPTDQDSMRETLPAEPPGGMEQFTELLDAYEDLHEHCQFWQDHTLQDSVNCAADIVHYNDKAPSYYGALIRLLPILEQDPPDELAVKQFKAILHNLSSQAKVYADHGELVRHGMMIFAEQSAQDQERISELSTKYDGILGKESPEIQELTQLLESDKENLKKWQDEYRNNVVTAATTPTYVWLWPFGTVAAGIVAGVYGKKATDALAKVHAYEDLSRTHSDELQAATVLMLDLTRIYKDLSDISGQITAALPVIQNIQGVWTAIHSDLQNVLRIIDQDIDQVPALIRSLGIEEAIRAWGRVAHDADVYRHTAYITVTTEDEAKKAAVELYELLKDAQRAF